MGGFSRAMFPLPVILTSRDAASCTGISSLDSPAVMLNFPTPPPKDAGAPSGSLRTCTVFGSVTSLLRMLW